MTSKIVQQRLLEALETLGRRIRRLRRAVRKLVRENGLLKARCAELEIRCAELEELSTTDPLTELSNLRDYQRNGKKLLRSIQWECLNSSQKEPSSIIYVDIDNFKPVNDYLGHDFGDRILRALSEILRDSTRRNDVVARIGGDEFVIILHRKSVGEAIRFAQRIAYKFQETSQGIIPQDSSIAPSISFGIYSFTGESMGSDPPEKEALDTITKNAEKCLRKAKNKGKGLIEWLTEHNKDSGTEKCLP